MYVRLRLRLLNRLQIPSNRRRSWCGTPGGSDCYNGFDSVCLVKKNRSKRGTYNIYMDYKRGDGGSVVPSSSCGDELKIIV